MLFEKGYQIIIENGSKKIEPENIEESKKN